MKSLLPALFLSLGISTTAAAPANAYPVDCAILLCLAGGWPASAECTHARAVFIRRITPWPIEPPLQIWNCPMRIGFTKPPAAERLFDAKLKGASSDSRLFLSTNQAQIQKVSGTADVDISGSAFDFVRSIHVFEITYQMQQDGDGSSCQTWSSVFEGSYGPQGEYRRRATVPAAVPAASSLRVPTECGNYWHRSVFVEWRDYEGTYGHEEVKY